MSIRRIVVILCGTICMLVLMLLRKKQTPQVKLWKYPVISLILTAAGVAGTMLLFYIESGRFGGTSFYGALLLVPVLMLPTLLLRVSYRDLMDICAPAESLMLAVMKLECKAQGCCSGKYIESLGRHFPSQMVEMAVTLCIMLALICIGKDPRNRGSLYGWYLVIYGATRFILNFCREGLTHFVWVLPAGNFWSLIAIAFGVIWILVNNLLKEEPKTNK